MSATSAISVESAVHNLLCDRLLATTVTHDVTHVESQMSGTTETLPQSLAQAKFVAEGDQHGPTCATRCTPLVEERRCQRMTLLCGCVIQGRRLVQLCEECNNDRLFTMELKRIPRRGRWRMSRETRIEFYTARAAAGQPLFPTVQGTPALPRRRFPTLQDERATA
jgi:hypothetical protein